MKDMTKMKKLELLAPAGNPELGMAAVDHGADAVYIGAERFGAREAAGNPVEDIEKLVRYAHRYRAGVYVTLNTMLFDHELDAAEKLTRRLYDMGVDALIVQDPGMLEMDLPPIPLFASTQMHNYDPDRIRFLEDSGFKRIILARELSLDQIREIRSKTSVDLEFFVHGALCVSFSGQCYLSHHIGGRSANRGACGQPCRLPWAVEDSRGKTIAEEQYLLSLKDLNLSGSLGDLMDAGISSFKIEGRLKDMSYVKNITAFYRKKLDLAMEEREGRFVRASQGKAVHMFTPDPRKSFNRGFTEYFLKGRNRGISAFDSPKSLGEPAGKIKVKKKGTFSVSGGPSFANGDGLCFFDPQGRLTGLKINRVDGEWITPSDTSSRGFKTLAPGMKIFRNHDTSFASLLKGKSAERKVDACFTLCETDKGFVLKAEDEGGFRAETAVETSKEPAKNPEAASGAIEKQLRKTGDSIFHAREVILDLSCAWFIRPSLLNSMRRTVLEKLLSERENLRVTTPVKRDKVSASYMDEKLDYRGNVANRLSEKFYRDAGVKEIKPAFEAEKGFVENADLMTTRHCLRYSLGICTRDRGGEKVSGPLFIKGKPGRFRLEFDCKACVMKIQK